MRSTCCSSPRRTARSRARSDDLGRCSPRFARRRPRPGRSTTPASPTGGSSSSRARASGNQYSPTGRVDLNLSNRHRLSGSYWWQRFLSNPDLLNSRDPIFPGLANSASQNSYRTTGNSTLRSILGGNLVNEVKGGWQWSPNAFFSNVTADQFADQDGYGITLPGQHRATA